MKRSSLSRLASEQPNSKARELDLRSPLEIARIINREDRKVAPAVARALLQIARAIAMAAAALARGGRLIYVGAGTSGRIAALDASECPPTFGVSPDRVQWVTAGGAAALGRATEGSEDSRANGRRDLARLRPNSSDLVLGIAASGRTPYTIAAIQYARARGAKTVALTANRRSPLAAAADLAIVVETGSEVIAGSSRMKAGTAQKMVLNMISTAAMARLGYVFGNQMVNVHTRNSKLRARGVNIIQNVAGVSQAVAARALKNANGSVPVALLQLLAGISAAKARQRLRDAGGNLRSAIMQAQKQRINS